MIHCSVLYASETGTAEDVAFKLYRQSSLVFDSVSFNSLDSYDVLRLPLEEYCIFVTATSGDGEVPSNMQTFWKFLLRKALQSDSLKSLKFAVFGLGDSSYEKFNAAARRLSMRLKQLGGTELLSIGLGDDQAKYGLLTALDPWIHDLWGAIYHHTSRRAATVPELLENSYSLQIVSDEKPDKQNESLSHALPDESIAITPRVGIGTIIDNSRITQEDWDQDVRLLKIRLQDTVDESESSSSCGGFMGANYRAGDVAYIYPHNSPKDALRMLKLLQRAHPEYTEDTWVNILNISPSKRQRQLDDTRCSLFTLFTQCLDINAIPQRSFFEIVANFADNEEEKEKLVEISCSEGADIYLDFCVLAKRSFVEILEDFRSVKLSLEVLLEVIPRLSPRQYSIASSGVSSPGQMDLCVGLVAYKTRYGREKKGVCSEYIKSLTPGKSVLYAIRKGSLQLPVNSPAVLVGPGTGIAPMRAVIHERLHNHADMNSCGLFKFNSAATSSRNNKTLLFFGCRKKEKDFLFGEEWKSRGCVVLDVGTTESGSCSDGTDYNGNNSIGNDNDSNHVTVIPAFSRDQTNRIYVQHKMKEHGELIWKLLNEDGGSVFIAGSANKMPQDVKKSICRIIEQHGGKTETEAMTMINDMIKKKRYYVEAWS